MKTIYVMLNPNAKKFRTRRSSVKKYTKMKYEGLKLFLPQNLSELEESIKQAESNRPDYICIGGGDGTIHLVLTALINAYKPDNVPPILILKEGTMDNIARTIKLKGIGEEILERMILALKNGEPVVTVKRDTIEINNRYCFLFGTGFITNFLKLAYSGLEKGFLRNSLVGAITAKEALLNKKHGEIFKRIDLNIEADNSLIDIHPISGLLGGTVEHIGMGFSPLKDASAVPGKFQLIIVGMQPRKILFNIFRLRTGERITDKNYDNIHCSSLFLKHDGVFDYTMDGDLYSAENELRLSMGPAIDLVKI